MSGMSAGELDWVVKLSFTAVGAEELDEMLDIAAEAGRVRPNSSCDSDEGSCGCTAGVASGIFVKGDSDCLDDFGFSANGVGPLVLFTCVTNFLSSTGITARHGKGLNQIAVAGSDVAAIEVEGGFLLPALVIISVDGRNFRPCSEIESRFHMKGIDDLVLAQKKGSCSCRP